MDRHAVEMHAVTVKEVLAEARLTLTVLEGDKGHDVPFTITKHAELGAKGAGVDDVGLGWLRCVCRGSRPHYADKEGCDEQSAWDG